MLTTTNSDRVADKQTEETPAVPQRRRLVRVPEFAALVVVLLATCVFFAAASPVFLTAGNFTNILSAVAVTGIIAAPGTLLLISGQFDLSVGSGAALCGMVMAYVGGSGHHLVLGVLAALLVGLVMGVINGFFVSVLGISSLVTTLAGLAIFRGATQVVSNGQTLSLTGFSGLGTSRAILGVALPVWIFLLVIFGFWILMRYSVYGRNMYAIGSNDVAARLSGIRSARAIFVGFLLSGLCVAIAGLILVSQLSAAVPTAATGLELSVVTAIVLGGTSLSGGRGSVLGTLLGLLVMGVLNNGLVLLNVNSFWQQVAQGIMLILAVSIGQIRAKYVK